MTTKITEQNISNLANFAVDWQSVITADGSTNTTAVAGKGYFIDTTSAAHTIVLPASPSFGDTIIINDYASTFNTNNVTINVNGSKVEGETGNAVLSENDQTITFVYTDTTQGWKIVNQDTASSITPTYISATGGTILTSGDFKTHVFTGDGCFVVSQTGSGGAPTTVEYLVVAGGGGGNSDWSGGSGAGGWRSYTSLPGAHPLNAPAGLPVSATTYPVTVGAGAAGGTGPNGLAPNNGSSSVFSTISSAGGGRGGQENNGCGGVPGGSGGGNYYAGLTVGAGNTPPVSPPQGNPGAGGPGKNPSCAYGGGGGAGQAGIAGVGDYFAGAGGNGAYVPDDFFGPTAPSYGQSPAPLAPNGRYFAGGSSSIGTSGSQQCGGAGGGGKGGFGTNCSVAVSTAGAANTGGGGGSSGGNEQPNPGKAGGKGIVVVRYKYQ
jgi:hypothetical protein